jgi:hypothetical protein
MKVFVNTSCANVYRLPTFHSETDTQVVLWEELEVLDEQTDFYRVLTEDHYEGWINRHQVVPRLNMMKSNFRMITRREISFFDEPSCDSQPIRDGAAGAFIPVYRQENQWLLTRFPDNQWAWLEEEGVRALPSLSREAMMQVARSYLGIPYLWGGKTSKGLDCSGFVQLLHKLFGVALRRDAWMQFEDARHISYNPFDGAPGDLVFFSENRQRITHVGFCLGDGEVIHARGLVRINSLRMDDPDFSESLFRTFVEIRSTFPV